MKNFPTERNIRILLADDHPTVLLGIKSFLATQKQIEVVGEALSGTEVIKLARQLLPDIIVMDISMPDLNGIEATTILRNELPDTKIVILTMHDDREYMLQFLQCGASAYVLKKSSPVELVNAIEAVWKGGAYFSPQIAELLRKEHMTGSRSPSEPTLTEREEQVLLFIAKGKSSKEIADLLFISERTVNKHRENLMEKLNIHTIAELTHYAISHKLIEIKEP